MKLFVVLALVAAAAALPVEREVIQLESSGFEINPDGQYKYGYKQNDGNEQEQEGILKTVTDEDNKPRSVLVKSGYFYINDAQGVPQLFKYTADENGYRVESVLLPSPPSPVAL